MDVKSFNSAAAFRASLEQRLKAYADKQNVPVAALRLRVCFERYLARMFNLEPDIWALKGGYALELRWAKARTTKDVDVILRDKALRSLDRRELANVILLKLQTNLAIDLNDYFQFEVRLSELIQHATFGGARYMIIAKVAGKEFCAFRTDVVLSEGDYEPEAIPSQDWLAFAGIPAPKLVAISTARQFAEKLHAYTFEWETRDNSRTKDLLDMYRITLDELDLDQFKSEVIATFSTRNTHKLPETLLPPDPAWKSAFDEAAKEAGIDLRMDDAYAQLAVFFETNLRKV